MAAILGFALILVPLTYWDSLRWDNRPSFWDRSLTTYGQLGLAPLAEWPQRAADWAAQLGYLFGLPALSALMLLVAAAVGVRAILLLRETQRNRPCKRLPSVTPALHPPRCGASVLNKSKAQGLSRQVVSDREEASRPSSRLFPKGCFAIADCMSFSVLSRQPAPSAKETLLRRCVDAILALYIIGYLALHFAVTFQPWDRYLLPILPLVCVLAGRGLVLGWDGLGSWPKLRRPGRVMALLLLVPALLYAAGLGRGGPAARGQRPQRQRGPGSSGRHAAESARRCGHLPPLAGLALRLLPLRCAPGAALVGFRLEVGR